MKSPESLDNPERDLELANREARGGKRIATATADEALTALRQRIAMRLASPLEGAPIPECRDCYRRGWMAALQSLEE